MCIMSLHVRGGKLLLCRACIIKLHAVTNAFRHSRVLREHKHTQNVSTLSQTDVLDADEEHQVGFVICNASHLRLPTAHSGDMAKSEQAIAASISCT